MALLLQPKTKMVIPLLHKMEMALPLLPKMQMALLLLPKMKMALLLPPKMKPSACYHTYPWGCGLGVGWGPWGSQYIRV